MKNTLSASDLFVRQWEELQRALKEQLRPWEELQRAFKEQLRPWEELQRAFEEQTRPIVEEIQRSRELLISNIDIGSLPVEVEPEKVYTMSPNIYIESLPFEDRPEKVYIEFLREKVEKLEKIIKKFGIRICELEMKHENENKGTPKIGSEIKSIKKRLPKSERNIFKIVWRSSESELEILFRELVDKKFLSNALKYTEFADHFNIEGITSKGKINKMVWYGTEREIVYLVSMLVKKKKWPKSKQYKLVEYHFLNQYGNPFKSKQLSVTFDNLSNDIPDIDEILKKLI